MEQVVWHVHSEFSDGGAWEHSARPVVVDHYTIAGAMHYGSPLGAIVDLPPGLMSVWALNREGQQSLFSWILGDGTDCLAVWWGAELVGLLTPCCWGTWMP